MSLYAVVDAATGGLVREYPTITDEDLQDTVALAGAAAAGWAKTDVAERAAMVRRVGELHRERADELASIIAREMGKPLPSARDEVDAISTVYEFYADRARELVADEPVAQPRGEGHAVVRREPLGLLLGIMPWNYPYFQVGRFAAPNLVVGNATMIKHAPQCPESAAALQDVFTRAGLPDGVYTNIYATNEQVARVIADPRVRGVSVTGSERAGAAVAEIAGRHLKKVVLELGGSDPFIVLASDDLQATVEAAVGARLENTGQACNSAKRFIVVDELYEDFLQRFSTAMSAVKPSSSHAPGAMIGPLSSQAAAERLEDQVHRAIGGGARLVSGGRRDGNFFEPTVITDIGPDNPARKEELFGPVAQVYRAADEAEAIELANDTPYGLGAYVMTNDAEQAQRVAQQLETGMVYINVVDAGTHDLPFGGVKRSGFGREMGRWGAEEFVNRKLVLTWK